MKYLFVYGTLKKGYPLSANLEKCPYLGEAALPGYTMHHLGWYPGIRKSEGNEIVYGELYKVTNNDLLRLDAVEGVPHLYTRETVKVFINGEAHDCETYVYAREIPNSFISSGKWTGRNSV